MRLRASLLATAIAEAFAAEGNHGVLLVVDSLTRFAMAQREIGLAAGRASNREGLYTIRVEQTGSPGGAGRVLSRRKYHCALHGSDGGRRPAGSCAVDTVRSLLDGHIMLDRGLAAKGHYPPIAVLDSLSRLMPSIVNAEHLKKATELRHSLAVYARSEDLIRIGAYQRGTDAVLDRAVEVLPKLEEFLRQSTTDLCNFNETAKMFSALPS